MEKSKTPLISVITVTYNAAATIAPTLKSVAEQTFGDFEYIVMDGASTDSTVSMAKEAGIPHARIFSSPDKGLYHAMNKALAEARGQYVVFLNAGDRFHSQDTLSLYAKKIYEHDFPGILYGQTDIVDSEGRKIADRHLIAPENLTLQSFADGMVVCHQAFMALRKLTSFYDVKYRFSADYEWCIRCLQHSRENVYVGETVVDYLSEGLTTANRRKSLLERFRIMTYYYGFFPTLIRHFRFAKRFFNYNKKLKSNQ